MLRAVDNRWVRHLTDLDELREGIGLRAFAQLDPLIAYKKEAHEMYQEFVASIARDIVYAIYHVEFTRPAAPVRQIQTNRGDGGGQPQPARSSGKTIGRNDPCWCGSGKKYKNCHLRSDEGRAPAPAGGGQPQPTAVSKPSNLRPSNRGEENRADRRLPVGFLYKKPGFRRKDTMTRRSAKGSAHFVNLVAL